jgi:hypothetical protein
VIADDGMGSLGSGSDLLTEIDPSC